jgi:RimJ/RimL family protein N-acetyltransferase
MEVLTPLATALDPRVVLDGKHIRLQPVDPIADADELYANSHFENECTYIIVCLILKNVTAVWRFMFKGPYTVPEFKEYLSGIAPGASANIGFTVVDKKSGKKIGIVTYLNNVPLHRTIEIGGIWYTPAFHRTYANTESSYLLIKHAFEVGYRRVEWKCGKFPKLTFVLIY